MGLNEFKRLFFEIRRLGCLIVVRKHAFEDYPERGFSQREIVHLVQKGVGRVEVNRSPDAIKGSYLFFTKDDLNQGCKFVLVIEAVEIEGEEKGSSTIFVCSAYRESENET